MLHWNTPETGAETWTLWKDQKYLRNFEVWCWRKVISSTSLVVYKILRRLTEEKITLHTIKRTGSRRWMTRKKTSRYWMIFRPGEGAGNWRRKHRAALCGELELGEAVDLLQVRSWIGWILMNVAWCSLTIYRQRLDHSSSVAQIIKYTR